MDLFQFLENAKVYLQPTGGAATYKLDITPEGVSFSQSFTEKTYSERSIHEPEKYVDKGQITKASVANFSFTLPLLKEPDFVPIWNLAVSLNSNNTLDTFNLFFIIDTKAYVIKKCVFTSLSTSANKNVPISLALEGQGSRLYTWQNPEQTQGIVDPNGNISTLFSTDTSGIPTFGTTDIVARSGTRTFLPLKHASVGITGYENHEGLLQSSSLELQNTVSWLPYTTIQGTATALEGEQAYSLQYPETFYVTKRNVSGSATLFISNEEASMFTGHEDANTNVNVVGPNAWDQKIINSEAAAGSVNFYVNNLFNANFISSVSGLGIKFRGPVKGTSRVSVGPIMTMSLDWRLDSNSLSIASYLTHTTA